MTFKTFALPLLATLLGLAPLQASADTVTKVFGSPTANGGPVDYCFRPGAGCGQKAASAFCTSVGYTGVAGYSSKSATFTRYIGSSGGCGTIPGAVIAGAKHCKALRGVRCTKTVYAKEPGLPEGLPN